MSEMVASPGDTLAAPSLGAPQRFRWVFEIALLRAFEWSYMWVKDQAQSLEAKHRGHRNARRVANFEDSFNAFVEPHLQRMVMDMTWLIKALNLYYTTMHFAVTVGVLVFLYVRRRPFYSHARNVLLLSSALALIGYFAFPLQPPRNYACNCINDTLDILGGPWTYQDAAVQHIANPYAAMPSVHFSWALWSALYLARLGGRRSLRYLGVAHVVLTFFAIILTGNHYWLDAVGGALTIGVAALALNLIKGWRSSSSAPLSGTHEEIPGVRAG
jgi:hypothetical protein